eukprot:s830_g3.t1
MIWGYPYFRKPPATLWVTGLDEPKVLELCLQAGGNEVCEISGYLHKCSFTVGGSRAAVEAFRVMAKDAKALQLEYLKEWQLLPIQEWQTQSGISDI